MKKRIETAVAVTFTACLLIFSERAVGGARHGLDIWMNCLVPVLFPFSVATAFLSRTDFFEGFGGGIFSAIGVGAVAGYPLGASISSEICAKNGCGVSFLEKLVALSSFASPVFILKTAGGAIGMNAGIIILCSHYIAQAVLFLLLRPKTELEYKRNKDCGKSTGKKLSESVWAGIKGIVSVGGYLTVFSVITAILPEGLSLYAGILLEMSGGVFAIAGSELPFCIKTALGAFAVTWGGLCVIMQMNAVAGEHGASVVKLALYRLSAGIIAGVTALFLALAFG